jgi:general secretion pathway protein G
LTAYSRRLTAERPASESGQDSGAALSTVGCRLSTRRSATQHAAGFTLLELLIVMTIILILASMATPTYHVAIVRAREAVLRDDLYTLRNLIDQYTIDKQQPPATLQDLVDDGYLHGALPEDPFTNSNDTWRVDLEDVPLSPGQTVSGVVDVHSGSDDISSDGETAYSSW